MLVSFGGGIVAAGVGGTRFSGGESEVRRGDRGVVRAAGGRSGRTPGNAAESYYRGGDEAVCVIRGVLHAGGVRLLYRYALDCVQGDWGSIARTGEHGRGVRDRVARPATD